MTVSGFDQMRQLLEKAGLTAPPVPAPLAEHLTERGKWFYATREIDPGRMYSPPRYAAEVVADSVQDYAAFAHVGHGINSYEIVYHLVYGRLALFTGTGWGGVYMDNEKSSAAVRDQFRRCAELVDLVQAAEDKLPAPPHRLIVVEEEFSNLNICEWLDAPLGCTLEAAAAWLKGRTRRDGRAVSAAIDLLRRRPLRNGGPPGSPAS
jgi:hypothetical protein